MNYTFEELKKQVISLDFSKIDIIKNFNLQDLLKYVNLEIENTNNEIKEELLKIGNKNITEYNDLYILDEPIKLNSKIIISSLQLNLLKRIKVDLEII